MMEDEIELKAEALSRVFRKGVSKEHVETVYSEFNEQSVRNALRDEFSYEVLDAEFSKPYDESIETYSYVLKRNGIVILFQPHVPFVEGLVTFDTQGEAEEAANAHIDRLVDLEVTGARELALTESLR
jgi:hypothetical protein